MTQIEKKNPKSTFSNFSIKKEILKAIKELGFINPTPIQDKVIPILMKSGQDLIATAQTGTGKTAAFGLPILSLTNENNPKTQTLILCPTRELCIQISKDLKNYSKFLDNINIVPVYGGAKIDTQMRALKKGAQVVVGTPGRTKDLIKRRKLSIDSIDRVILDEADEMLSMGFKEDLESDAVISTLQEDFNMRAKIKVNSFPSLVLKYKNNYFPIKIEYNNHETMLHHINDLNDNIYF